MKQLEKRRTKGIQCTDEVVYQSFSQPSAFHYNNVATLILESCELLTDILYVCSFEQTHFYAAGPCSFLLLIQLCTTTLERTTRHLHYASCLFMNIKKSSSLTL